MPSFQVESLPVELFEQLFSLSDEALKPLKVKRLIVDAKPGYPCRVSLEDAEVGETVLLLKYDHLKNIGYYDASGPIFVRENAKSSHLVPGDIPSVVTDARLFSVRVYKRDGWMIDAQVIDGSELKRELEASFENADACFVDVHNARPGCFAFRAHRAG